MDKKITAQLLWKLAQPKISNFDHEENNPDIKQSSSPAERLGIRIVLSRNKRGMTCEELAIQSGLSLEELLNVEFGKSPLSLLVERMPKIEDALKIKRGTLIQEFVKDLTKACEDE